MRSLWNLWTWTNDRLISRMICGIQTMFKKSGLLFESVRCVFVCLGWKRALFMPFNGFFFFSILVFFDCDDYCKLVCRESCSSSRASMGRHSKPNTKSRGQSNRLHRSLLGSGVKLISLVRRATVVVANREGKSRSGRGKVLELLLGERVDSSRMDMGLGEKARRGELGGDRIDCR